MASGNTGIIKTKNRIHKQNNLNLSLLFMKRSIIFFSLILIFHFVYACSSDKGDIKNRVNNTSFGGNPRILITYFTEPETGGTDASSGASRIIINNKVMGNVEYIAKIIQEATNGDSFRLQTKKPYPGNHKALVDLASLEKKSEKRPELYAKPDSIVNYDIIFVGYPIWWSDMPMLLYTFLEEYDLKDKIIIPFSTHGGSGLSGTVERIEEIQKKASVTTGYTISRDNMSSPRESVMEWLRRLGFSFNQ